MRGRPVADLPAHRTPLDRWTRSTPSTVVCWIAFSGLRYRGATTSDRHGTGGDGLSKTSTQDDFEEKPS
jgi:hypothetical protein